MRAIATAEDLINLASDMMPHNHGTKPKSVFAVCEVSADDVRGLLDRNAGQIFQVYDQTVPRLDETLPHVPTHAGIFARLPPKADKNFKLQPGETPPKQLRKENALKLKRKLEERQFVGSVFRDGLFAPLNAQAAALDFQRPPKTEGE